MRETWYVWDQRRTATSADQLPIFGKQLATSEHSSFQFYDSMHARCRQQRFIHLTAVTVTSKQCEQHEVNVVTQLSFNPLETSCEIEISIYYLRDVKILLHENQPEIADDEKVMQMTMKNS